MERQEELFEKYPKLFAGITNLECKEEHYNIIDVMCGSIEAYLIKHYFTPPVIFTKINETEKGLGIYFTGGDDDIETIVRVARDVSRKEKEDV